MQIPAARPLATMLIVAACALSACSSTERAAGEPDTTAEPAGPESKLAKYTPFRLSADLGTLSENQRKMIPLLIDAARMMDDLFWRQAYGDKQALLDSINDPDLRRFAEINYGPWDRLDGNASFIDGVGPKPDGANFYPADMTKEEFEQAAAASADASKALTSLYTLVRRGDDGGLVAVPYHQAYAETLTRAAEKLRAAAQLAEDDGFRNYLRMRADALLSGEYRPSDLAWMDMKTNRLELVIGPIETYEDRLFGHKAAFEAYVLVKDPEWSERLAKYGALLPDLQRGLPVPDAYKRESPGTDSDLNAYDALFYAGDCNAGSKTIAINLPNDEQVQLKKGTRRLQLKNAMQAKFEKILEPIAATLIAPRQRKHVTFDAFFGNTMFHEVAHGLGIKNTIDGRGTVRETLMERASALEEGKADVLGLYMVTRLREQGEIDGGSLEDNYVTFIASIFRSIRFGASSAHGRANLARFNFFEEQGAIVFDETAGTYRVDFDKMGPAVDALSEKILRLQGDGDYDGVGEFMARYGTMTEGLQAALDRLASQGIPVDIVFEQGPDVLGL